jgi:hypothetical protein
LNPKLFKFIGFLGFPKISKSKFKQTNKKKRKEKKKNYKLKK